MPPNTSTVCQGLQSCLDPLLFEPRVSVHQTAPSKQGQTFPWPEKLPETETPVRDQETPQNTTTTTTWNFLQSLANKLADDECGRPEHVYVHPMAKRSYSSSLSSRSLEMCTESLGSETGSGIGADEFSHLFSERESSDKMAKTPKKVKHSRSFPPPLSSISGGDGVQVRTHREDGRLVIKAFSFSPYLRAERENGRLRLSLMRGFRDDGEEVDEEVAAENEEVEGEFVDELAEEEEEEEEEEKEEEEEEKEGDINGGIWGESLRDDGGKTGWKMDGGDWSSSRWCNGDRSSGKRLTSLPYCVAIS